MSLWFPAILNVTATSDETKDLRLTNQWYANQRYIISNLMLPCDLSAPVYKWKERSDCYWSLSPKSLSQSWPFTGESAEIEMSNFTFKCHKSLNIKKMLIFLFLLSVFPVCAPAVIAVAAPARFSTGKMTFLFLFLPLLPIDYCEIFIPKLTHVGAWTRHWIIHCFRIHFWRAAPNVTFM